MMMRNPEGEIESSSGEEEIDENDSQNDADDELDELVSYSSDNTDLQTTGDA